MKRAGIKNFELAEKIGMSRQQFSYWMNKAEDLTHQLYQKCLNFLPPETKDIYIDEENKENMLFNLLTKQLATSRTILDLLSIIFQEKEGGFLVIHDILAKHEKAVIDELSKFFPAKNKNN